jgi:membrane associated rhomboid family serine protease
MFLHGSLAHIAGNMLYLWIFGDNVEDSMGRIRFIIFYLSCGVIAALAQGFVDPSSNIPMVGASGAIAGVLGAYLLLYPRANVKCLFFIIIIIQMVRIPAFIVLGFWIFGQFFSAPFSLESEGGTAYFAHIGGFIAGMILIPFFKKKETKLFNNKANSPWTVFQTKDNMIKPDKNFLQDFINKSEKEIKNRK